MLPRLEYRVIIFGLIKCKLPSHLQEHAITTWWRHMPLPEQAEDLTEHKQYDVCGFMHTPQVLSSALWICNIGRFFSSSLVVFLFDYISCQRLVLLKNSYLGIPQPNPNLPRCSLALCVWMSVFISQPRDRVVLSIVLKEEREFLDSIACFCLWLCSLLCFLDCTLSSSFTPTTPACESRSTVKTLKYTYDLLTTP